MGPGAAACDLHTGSQCWVLCCCRSPQQIAALGGEGPCHAQAAARHLVPHTGYRVPGMKSGQGWANHGEVLEWGGHPGGQDSVGPLT